jgi:hypothetical protein
VFWPVVFSEKANEICANRQRRAKIVFLQFKVVSLKIRIEELKNYRKFKKWLF